jgi:hypothetical protein
VTRYRIGSRVTIVSGHGAGTSGRITHRAHADVRPHLEWIVTPDDAQSEFDWFPVRASQLGPWTVPSHARPVSVGALAGGGR